MLQVFSPIDISGYMAGNRRKLTNERVLAIYIARQQRGLNGKRPTYRLLAEQFNVSLTQVSGICTGRSYCEVTGNYSAWSRNHEYYHVARR